MCVCVLLLKCRSARRMFGPADCQSLACLRALRVFRSVSARRAVDASLETGEIRAKFTSPLHQTPGESPHVCSPTPKGDGRQTGLEQLLLRVSSSWLVPLNREDGEVVPGPPERSLEKV